MGWNGKGTGPWREWITQELVVNNGFTRLAEIGVYKAHLAKKLVEVPDLEILYLIDPYTLSSWDTMKQKSPKRLEEIYEYSKGLFEDNAKVIFWRAFSVEAAKYVPDGSLDFVFIDAIHTYKAIKQDIAAWKPKVRKGGILAGDDYWGKYPDHMRAIDEEFPDLNEANGRNWWVRC